MPSDGVFLTDLAARLGVHPHTVRHWILTGVVAGNRRVRLAATRLGGRWQVSESAIEEFRAATNPPAGKVATRNRKGGAR